MQKISPVSVAILTVLLQGALMAQAPAGGGVLPNTIQTGAEGKFEAAPDTALVQFNISSQETTPKVAYERAQRQAQTLRDILRANGIDPSAAELGFFSIQPVYDWKQPQHKIVGYRVNTNVSLKLKDFTKVGPIVQQLGEQEFAENVNLSYTLDDMEAAKLKAVEDAFSRARAEANTIARISGRSLGELLHASVDASTPIPIMAPMVKTMQARAAGAEMAPPTAEFSASKIIVNAHVAAVFGMR
jgi:uncharacterized protein YggE